MTFDPTNVVEALYRTDLAGSAWLENVMQGIQPLLDPTHRGVHGEFYRCPDPLSFAPEHAPLLLGFDDGLRVVFDEGMQNLSEEFVGGTFLASGVVRGATVEGWSDISTVRDGGFRALGLVDVLNIVTVEPDGTGCGISNFRAAPAVLEKSERHMIGALYRHFTAAHRLQPKLHGQRPSPELADAIVDANGRVHHVRCGAIDPARLEALKIAAGKAEESRGRRRRQDPHGALDAWESLVEGRWTFVDHFDLDGRRYLLALENAAKRTGFELLSPRERDVVENALRGSDNKLIAYDLGISTRR